MKGGRRELEGKNAEIKRKEAEITSIEGNAAKRTKSGLKDCVTSP